MLKYYLRFNVPFCITHGHFGKVTTLESKFFCISYIEQNAEQHKQCLYNYNILCHCSLVVSLVMGDHNFTCLNCGDPIFRV